MELSEVLGYYYQKYVLNLNEVREDFPEPDWKDCTRYLIGFFMKIFLLKEWRSYDLEGKLIEDWDLRNITSRVWEKLELCDDSGAIYDYLQAQMEQGQDHYPNRSLMDYLAEDFVSDYEAPDILECIGVANDLFIGRRDSYEMYDQAYGSSEPYDPSLNWPFPGGGETYLHPPYLQGQDPVRSNALIWVPLPILRFAFFAKEVARFGRSFDGMQAVAQAQLSALDFTLIHAEYRLILEKVLTLEDTAESRSALDILSNNLFLGEKPLTQAWVDGPEELPWIR
jgi:hypothetical protein